MADDTNGWREATLALHAGDPARRIGGPVAAPPMLSTSFYIDPDAIGFSGNDATDADPYFYTRWNNPTTELLERRLAALDGGEAAAVFASGMAAVSALFATVLRQGDHLVLSNVCYAGVAELAHDILPRQGIEVTTVDLSDPAALAAAIRPTTRLVHAETPANPILRLTDIEAVAEIAHAVGVPLSVDATMATPVGIRPLALGADYVVHSLTKYLCGHGDALGGAVIGRKDAIERVRKDAVIHLGGTLAPFSAWLILRGIETLRARMALHEANARRVEAFLADHPKVRAVYWPGSERHPQHDLARRQMRNFSGMLSFCTHDDGLPLARRLAERLKVFSYAVSLGKTKSLLFYIPTESILAASFHLEGRAEQDYRDWIGSGAFRVSVGLEDPDDLIEDLAQALG